MQNKKWYQSTWFTILALIFFFPLGLFLMWKYTHWNKIAKIGVSGFFALILLIGMFGEGSSDTQSSFEKGMNAGKDVVEQNNNQPTQQSQQQAVKAEPTKAPVKSFTDNELTEDAVKNEIKSLSGGRSMSDKDMVGIELIDHAGTDVADDKIVKITYRPKSVWDEKDLAKKTTDTMVTASEKLFKHPKVGMVRIWTEGEFTDQYGKKEFGNAVRLGLNRTTAAKIEWNNFKDMVFIDHNRLLDIVDENQIHPAIRQKI